jgi:hypothetical protein
MFRPYGANQGGFAPEMISTMLRKTVISFPAEIICAE